jgi:Gpi18-like mannosyltransferase
MRLLQNLSPILPTLAAIFVATELWRWTRESWAMGHACRMLHTVFSAPQPPLHLLSSTGFDGMPTVGRFAVRRCTARTQSPPDPKGVGG